MFYVLGVNSAMNVVEELKPPLARHVVISVVVSHVAIMLIYLLTNFAYVAVLSPEEILASDATALTFGERWINHSFDLSLFSDHKQKLRIR